MALTTKRPHEALRDDPGLVYPRAQCTAGTGSLPQSPHREEGKEPASQKQPHLNNCQQTGTTQMPFL